VNWPAIQAIIFDAEGVVIDTEPLWDEAQRLLLERRGVAYDRARVKHLIAGKSAVDGIAILQRDFNIAGVPQELAKERNDTVRGLIAGRVQFIPGFPEFFARIQDRYKTCIATSMAPELLPLVNERLHLNDLFGDRIFSLADVGNRSKPDPALFLFAAQKLATPPAHCLVIEDSPNGIEAAKRAKMYCFGLATTFPPALLQDATEVVASYQELERTLQFAALPA